MTAFASVGHNPRLKGRREDTDVVATAASFYIICGLAICSLISFSAAEVLCQCNPSN